MNFNACVVPSGNQGKRVLLHSSHTGIGVSRGRQLGNCPVLENLLPSDFLRTDILPSAWEITVTDKNTGEFNGKIVANSFMYAFFLAQY